MSAALSPGSSTYLQAFPNCMYLSLLLFFERHWYDLIFCHRTGFGFLSLVRVFMLRPTHASSPSQRLSATCVPRHLEAPFRLGRRSLKTNCCFLWITDAVVRLRPASAAPVHHATAPSGKTTELRETRSKKLAPRTSAKPSVPCLPPGATSFIRPGASSILSLPRSKAPRTRAGLAGCLAADWRLAGGWLAAAGWQLAGGWLAAGSRPLEIIRFTKQNVHFSSNCNKNAILSQ